MGFEDEIDLEQDPNQFEANAETCEICFCTREKLELMPNCSHKFCEDCIVQYLKNSIENNSSKLLALTCPESSCNKTLSNSFIKSKLRNDLILLEKYKRFSNNLKYRGNSSYKPCIRVNCDYFAKKQFFGDKMVCVCGQMMCYKCKKEWHPGAPCNQVYNEEDFTIYQIENRTKSCPKCQIIIKKDLGCNHMTCLKCHHEFCWICYSEWDKIDGTCPKQCREDPENRQFDLPPENTRLDKLVLFTNVDDIGKSAC